SKITRKYSFIEKITFHHTKQFFGFETEDYLGFKIHVASPEKAIIDSVGHTPLAAIEDAFNEIDVTRMLAYIKKIKKSSIAKRMGYILESRGHNVFPELRGLLNKKYIFLDPLAKNKTEKNKKWGLIL
ncbi:MAG: hypothetical protein KAJ24_02505, partial [Candidatus Aenigmarchaeota archaeon]|nr:hypothetical protein [Candidatus Aenigmarchaeota archaeon]